MSRPCPKKGRYLRRLERVSFSASLPALTLLFFMQISWPTAQAHHSRRRLCFCLHDSRKALVFSPHITNYTTFSLIWSVSMNSKDIVIIGSSFISRLHNDLCGKSHNMCNLRLDPDFVRVAWFAAGGLTYRKLHGEGPLPPLESLLHADAAVIHLGGNDLCDRRPDQILSIIENWTIPTLQRLGCAKIVLCCVFHRRQGRLTTRLDLVEYNQNVDMFNKSLQSLSRKYDEVEFWDHSDVVNGGSVNRIWHADGVHLASNGTKFLFRSIRGAVWYTTKQLFR